MSPNESCKCSTSGMSACNYGECNGHSSKETNSNLHGPYCEKHKPTDDALATLVPSPTALAAISATTTNCRCPCKSTQSGAISSQKIDESSNDSLNTNECQCQFRSFDPTAPEEDLSMIVSSSPSTSTRYSPPQEPSVQPLVCIKCSSIELENNKTKSKLEQLRLVMQQKKERREARKLRGAPYGARVVGASSQLSPSNNGLASATIPTQNDVVTATGQQQPNHLVEEVDTAA